MAGCTVIPEHRGALAGRSCARRILLGGASASVLALFGARGEAQEPTSSNLPAAGVNATPESLPGIVRVQGGWTADIGRGSNADVLTTEANVTAVQLAIDQATEMVGVSEAAANRPEIRSLSLGGARAS
jgi:hypothetical protein